ncbi:methionyl-tRNA formyltransferase [candidate division KSB1 bacterium]|nr:methionyl-tRNA formyltransferase [candidate division KSB1 bacterium]
MGTPDFSIPSLKRLFNSSHTIVAVVTGQDKPAGRGQRMQPTPVRQFADEHNIPVLMPASLKDPVFHDQLRTISADLYVVVAFRILPREAFTIPPKGTINLHGSLLPKYRGAAPINWAIMNGEKETGVTTFFITDKVDTGNIILSRSFPIGDDETAGDVHDKMSEIGADLLLETVNLIALDQAPRNAQQGTPSPAPKITKDVCRIDWSKDAQTIKNQVRGLAPYPGAIIFLNGKQFKIYRLQLETQKNTGAYSPGQIVEIQPEVGISVATGDTVVTILELQPESKRRMTAAEYIRGVSDEMMTGTFE